MYDGANVTFPTIGALLLTIGIFFIVKKCNWEKWSCILKILEDSILPVYLLHNLIITFLNKLIIIKSLFLFSSVIGAVIVFAICVMIGKVVPA